MTVDEMYGDWDWEAAVAAVGRSLDPRPHTSIFDTLECCAGSRIGGGRREGSSDPSNGAQSPCSSKMIHSPVRVGGPDSR